MGWGHGPVRSALVVVVVVVVACMHTKSLVDCMMGCEEQLRVEGLVVAEEDSNLPVQGRPLVELSNYNNSIIQ